MTLLGGIDLGGTKIQSLVCGADGEPVGQDRRPTPTGGTADGVADVLADSLRAACAAAGVEPDALGALGIGAPGAIDPVQGRVLHSPNLPGFDEPYPLAQRLTDRTGVEQVRLLNDVEAGVEGEHRLGAGRPYRNLLAVFVGTGVGGAAVLDGRLWAGRGAACEIGHIVVRIGGRRCGCGRRGCLEAYAGRASMERRARTEYESGRPTSLFRIQERKGRPRLTSGVWAEALMRGDELATELVDGAVEALGAGIASAQNLYDVEAVIIGGGLADKLGPEFVERVARAMSPHLFKDDQPPDVLPTGLGDLGGATGAALAAGEWAGVTGGEPAPVGNA